jgi:predicted transcriptional regulator
MESSNRNSARILRIVRVSPGIHLREIERLLNLSLHSVRYHVDLLARSGLIVCDKDNGYSRVFPPNTSERDIVLYSHLRVNSSRRILTALVSNHSLSNKEICQSTGLAKSTVSEAIQEFLESDVVAFEISDLGIKVKLQDAPHVAKLIDNLGPILNSNDVVERFADLWDF